jgi:uncharacterized protein (TIGR02466 family)
MPRKETPRKIIQQEFMWPTPYWRTLLPDFVKHKTRVSFNEDMENWVSGQMEQENNVYKSNRGGWQSELQKPEGVFEPLKNEIAEFCKHLPLNIKDIHIPQMWVNVNKKGDWNTIHQHGHYHLSGTYYVKVPKNSGKLVFRDPRPAALANLFMVNRFDGGEMKIIDISDGTLIVWPSFLDHFVEPSQTDEERISISFDIMAR